MRSVTTANGANLQIPEEVGMTPVLRDKREDREHRNREQVVIKHGVPVGESGCFDPFPHSEHLSTSLVRYAPTKNARGDTHVCGAGQAIDEHPEIADVQL